MRDIAISRIMTPDPLTVGPDDTVAAAKILLDSRDIHHLPVVEDGALVGMLSTSDFLKLNVLRERPRALEAIKVRRIMEAEPVTLEISADLIDVATRLSDGSFHALPVVESGNVLVGIVTSTDLINHLLMQVPSGDGSLREVPAGLSGRAKDVDITAAVRLARETLDSGTASQLADAVLRLHDENRLLKEVYEAAELYLRSGQAEHEHGALQKRLTDVQRSVLLNG
jgi:CBS domain-containing membrane protein